MAALAGMVVGVEMKALENLAPLDASWSRFGGHNQVVFIELPIASITHT